MFKHSLVAAVALVSTLALIYSTSPVESQRFAPGYCPTIVAHDNFDKTRFFGNWIEVEKTPSIFDLMMRCLVVDYSDDQDNTVNVVVRGISLAGLPLTVNGDGLLQDVHRSGFYSIRYGFGVPFQGTLTTIIDTDYDDYAVVYSCTNSLLSGVFHSEYIWVLSRSGKISNPTRQNIYEKLDKLQINRSGLTMSDRSTCPTNSSTVARESDKDLAAQPINGSNAQSTISNASAASDASIANSPATGSSGSAAPAAAVADSDVKVEPTQKSVVVPLLYDPPSQPASAQKPASAKANSPADNKLAAAGAQKPALSGSSKPAQQAASSSAVANSQQQVPQQGTSLVNSVSYTLPVASQNAQPVAAPAPIANQSIGGSQQTKPASAAQAAPQVPKIQKP